MSKLFSLYLSLSFLVVSLVLPQPAQAAAKPDIDFSIVGVNIIYDNLVHARVRCNKRFKGQLDITFTIPGRAPKTLTKRVEYKQIREVDLLCFAINKYPSLKGFKTVKFKVDIKNKIKEKSETNNGYAKSIKFPTGPAKGKVDFEVKKVIPGSHGYKVIIRNNGPKKYRGELRIGVALNENKKPDVVHKCRIVKLGTTTVKIPCRLKPGRNILQLKLDKNNSIPETNEKNNSYTGTFYPAIDKVAIVKNVGLRKPGVSGWKISTGGKREMAPFNIQPKETNFKRRSGTAEVELKIGVRGLGSIAKGPYSVSVCTYYDGKSHGGTKKIFPKVPINGKINYHINKWPLAYKKNEWVKLRITVGRPNKKGVYYVRDTLDIPIRFTNFY